MSFLLTRPRELPFFNGLDGNSLLLDDPLSPYGHTFRLTVPFFFLIIWWVLVWPHERETASAHPKRLWKKNSCRGLCLSRSLSLAIEPPLDCKALKANPLTVNSQDLWLAKDNRFLNPKISYERILMAPPCRLINERKIRAATWLPSVDPWIWRCDHKERKRSTPGSEECF